MSFIVFNSVNEAKNYIKRNSHLNENHFEVCGCCGHYSTIFLDGKKVVYTYDTVHMDEVTTETEVLGRIR